MTENSNSDSGRASSLDPAREVTDEELMAFADGELDDGRRAHIAAILAASPQAAQKLAAFTSTGRHLSELFEQPMMEAVPPRLLEMIRNFPAHEIGASPGSDNVIQMAARKGARLARSQQMWLLAPAACAALAVAGVGAQMMFNTPTDRDDTQTALADGVVRHADGTKIAGSALAAALDNAPSRDSTRPKIAGQKPDIIPVFTFASAHGGYCRQYVMSSGQASATYAGVACRETAGRWRVEIHKAVDGGADKSGQIVVAGKAGMADIDAVVDRLLAGAVLGPDEEAALLSGGWQTGKR